MTVSPFDSAVYGALFSDETIAEQFRDAAELRAMLEVEAALARVEGRLGIIPQQAADAISAALQTLVIDPATLASGTASAGMPVPDFVAALQEAVGGDAASFVHWGSTTQDIMDTGLVLRLRAVADELDARLRRLIERLAGHADAQRDTVMAARTRSQQAAPISFGLKVAGWLAPLVRHRTRLAELRPRLLAVQCGGAVGSLAALGDRGVDVMQALGEELALTVPPVPWHAQRDSLAEFAGWLSMVSGSLGKMGHDLVLLAQSEVREVRAGTAGGSSTLPQKANPIGAEILVTLARLNAGLLGGLHQAMIQEHERGGPGWSLEWTVLPQMATAAGAALRHAEDLADTLEVDADRMAANLAASNGLLLAEAASYALATVLPKPEAQALVKQACKTAAADGRHLIDVLQAETDAAVDWEALRDPANYLGAADALIDRAIAAAKD